MASNGCQVPPEPTRILKISGMVVAADLESDKNYADLMEDIVQECEKSGSISCVVIPRPEDPETARTMIGKAGFGQVFVEYAEVEQALKAYCSLTGRQFDSKPVMLSYCNE